MTTGLLTTTAGRAAIIADLGGGADLVLTQVAWGDSNGVPYAPNEAQTVLVNEKYRAGIASVAVVAGAIVVDAIIPADTNDGTGRPSHGFNVAEVGLFSSTGTLIGLARCGNGYKPPPSSGQAAAVTYRLKLAVANPSAITVVIDPQAQISIGRHGRAPWLTVDGVLNDPPANPNQGDTYIIGTAPTGAWTGFANRIAQWVGVWSLATAPLGHHVVDNSKAVDAATRWLRRDVGGWVSANASELAIGPVRLATIAEVKARLRNDLAISPANAVFQQIVTGTINLYVRTDGNDANDGSANTAAKAFATPQGAFNYIANNFAPSLANFYIYLADGTYPKVAWSQGPAHNVTVVGNVGTPANVVIDGGTGTAVSISNFRRIDFQGLTIQSPGGTYGLVTGTFASAGLSNIRWGYCPSGIITAQSCTSIILQGSHTIFGGGAHFGRAQQAGALLYFLNAAVTISGSLYIGDFVLATSAAHIETSGSTFSGTNTGRRYNATQNAIIVTNGGGTSVFPGNTAGVTSSDGKYY